MASIIFSLMPWHKCTVDGVKAHPRRGFYLLGNRGAPECESPSVTLTKPDPGVIKVESAFAYEPAYRTPVIGVRLFTKQQHVAHGHPGYIAHSLFALDEDQKIVPMSGCSCPVTVRGPA